MKVELVNRPQHFNSCLAATDTAVLIMGIHHKTKQTLTKERKRIQPLVAKKLRLHIKTGETDFYSQGPNVLAAPKADLSAQPLL